MYDEPRLSRAQRSVPTQKPPVMALCRGSWTHPHPVITVMADKPNMMEITSFDKTKLKKTQTQEKNPLPTKEAIEQERRESSS
ncbi:hypothetical protein PGIGA_G00062320 [Pangasianodon gigas]|uniref:Uncharacterized protein n=1 Tax=Pangasianodon gigas TaxID=30993 RepID=A0ACC5X7A3_PANGG|nr:hypothetical protein [Pangasianodon gigas]